MTLKLTPVLPHDDEAPQVPTSSPPSRDTLAANLEIVVAQLKVQGKLLTTLVEERVLAGERELAAESRHWELLQRLDHLESIMYSGQDLIRESLKRLPESDST